MHLYFNFYIIFVKYCDKHNNRVQKRTLLRAMKESYITSSMKNTKKKISTIYIFDKIETERKEYKEHLNCRRQLQIK
jgi:hypothetical protein